MRIDGEWYVGDDGVARPVIRGEILAANDTWVRAPFLLDTGADRTVLSAAILRLLGLPWSATGERIGGLGGVVPSAGVETRIRLTRDGRNKVLFRGYFSAVTDLEALDMCVLGRDITGLFAVIVDRPGDTVSLIGQRHWYRIERAA
jgi:hypothetical protein